ncbi:MAG: hypothetical protein ACYDAG_16310, partial [Chloroflexota bacterium]
MSDERPVSSNVRAFRIGTRGSRLALWQANHVAALLAAAFPFYHFQI